jgi:hypothetical protein
MKFRTEIPIESHPFITYESELVFIGSCFSTHIHNRLKRLKFDSLSNPFGIVYNPISLAHQLKRTHSGKPYSDADLRFHAERWYSFDHHSDFSFPTAEECLLAINNSLEEAHKKIQSASVVFLTLGSAWAYFHESVPEKVVSNCHKIPGKEFTKKLISVELMAAELAHSISLIREINPKVKIQFSVSPVRHLADGFFENQLSKGRLFDVIYELGNQISGIGYFPAFELLHDDLRDYRFYSSDLIHPSEEAINYIWEKFSQSFFTQKTTETAQKVEKIIQATQHRPFHPGSEAHQKFIASTLSQMDQLEKLVFGNFDSERKILSEGITRI